ncbi:BCCT family transporter [Aeromicrobium sp. 636]|uniref:BCCT family transporter n=1 Tax=Aeromicrobium senzhongii TaxID=2663859 RepID=A0A8I0K2Z1_9ACTN|nr:MULTISPECIES: BCCT family transporter [Aeromicrobium]MBC9227139.1 BCCT family transporter [Aeromicrobium senzhongii]MCQ3999238.1 BCCT family transporter [Aeromicrobium sp. 636]
MATGLDRPIDDVREPELEPQPETRLDRAVFGIAAVLALAVVTWGLVDQASLGSRAAQAQSWVIEYTGWLYVLSTTGFVVFAIWVAASRYGKIPLGRDGERPEFRTTSWIAMMFSAGMGIGLMFWGVAEPLTFYLSPPPGTVEAGTDGAAQVAMAQTLFHWTLHPWAVYAVVGLAIGYGTFRLGRPQLISSAFTKLLGRKQTRGPLGKAIDIMAIFATLFGSAASLGLGALQIGAGIEHNGWVDSVGETLVVVIIVVLTILFILSAVSGVARGIQWLSNINMVLALVLAAFVFIAGPTLTMLNLIPTSIADYVAMLPEMAGRTNANGAALADWLGAWTIFYWAWWVSWTPFVGMFIARISRGRTIRQFVTGVLLVPSMVSLVWFAIFGGAGINDAEAITGADGVVDSNYALFDLLQQYPLASVMTVLVMVLVGIFFVSGADAASLVMGTLTQRGSIHPSTWNVIFWGALTGAVAAIMLLIADPGDPVALQGLQALTIVASLPFLLVMVLLCVSLYRDLREDPIILREDLAQTLVEEAVIVGVDRHGEDFSLVVEESTTGWPEEDIPTRSDRDD